MRSTISHRRTIAIGKLILVLFSTALSLSAADEPSLRIQRADEKDVVKVTVESSSLSLQLSLQAMNTVAVSKVRVVVGDLLRPDGDVVKPDWQVDGKPGATAEVNIPGLQERPLVIKAQLPVTGTYSGSIDLIYEKKRHSFVLTITRADVTVPANITPIDTVRADSCWVANPVVRVALTGTHSEKVTLDRPFVKAFGLKDSDKVKTQAHYDGVSVKSVDASGNQADVGSTFQLNGQSPLELLVTILNVDAPGEYTGTMVISSGDFKPASQDFTVYVRNRSWVAAFFIIVGVAVSWGLRRWAKTDRPRLLAQRQIAELSSEVDAFGSQISDATEAEERVLQSFLVRLAALYEKWDRNAVDATDSTEKEIEEKLNLFRDWVNLRRRFDSVRPPQVAASLRQRLLDVELRFSVPSSSDQLKALRDELTAISSALAAAIRNDLVTRIKSITDEATQQKGAASETYAGRIQTEVLDVLSQAGDLAQKDRSVEAGAAVDKARLAYASIMAAQLEDQLPSQSPDLKRIPQPEWDTLVAQVQAKTAQARSATDPETAISCYVDAYSLYLSKLLEALRRRVAIDLEKVEASSLAKKEDSSALLNQVAELVDAASASLTRREVVSALAVYQKSKVEIEGVEQKLSGLGVAMGGASGQYVAPPDALPLPSVSSPGSSGQEGFAMLPQRARRIQVSVTTLDARIKRNEMVFTLVVGAVSTLTGVLLLWIPAPAWGSLKDYITATLWGLGLHQVSGSVMGSFDWTTMTDKLSGTGGGNVKN